MLLRERPERELERLRRLQRIVYDIGMRFASAKSWVLALVIPTYLIYADGKTEVIYPPEVTKMLAKYDEMCQQEISHVMDVFERGRYGFDPLR